MPPWVTPMPVAEVEYVVQKFRAACLGGQASFAKNEIVPIEYKTLPSEVRWFYKSIKGQQIFQLKLSHPAYLISFKQKPGGYYYHSGCAVIARDMPFVDTWEKVLKVRFTHEEGRQLVYTDTHVGLVEYPIPEEKMKLSIQRLASPFIALQATRMSDWETRDWKASRPFTRKPKKAVE